MKDFVSGRYLSQGSYKAFIPQPVHRLWAIDDMQVINLLSQADLQLGRLDMYSQYVNIDLYIQVHIAKEATQSSRIEGTQTNVEEAFMLREQIDREKRDDWDEVQNYIRAMNEAVAMLDTLPLSLRLICHAHRTLLQGVRGEHKLPGEFRRSQNWIGGATLRDAAFIPPPHPEIASLMSDMEQFIHDEGDLLPDLLKIALVHYQFETIHPFLDGNGRVGRLLIPLFLISKGVLKRPILYLSDFFEQHRMLYYDNLMRVRTHNDLNQWLRFFLTGVIETARHGIATFDGILQLQQSLNERILVLGSRSADARKLLNYLYIQPVVDSEQVASIIKKSNVSAYKLLSDFQKLNIVSEITGNQRGKLYLLHQYMDLFQRKA